MPRNGLPLVACTLCLLVLPSCTRQNASEPGPATPQKSVSVVVVPAEVRSVRWPVEALGTVKWASNRIVSLTARTAGRLDELRVFPGDRVTSGARIAAIASPEFLAAETEWIQARTAADRNVGIAEGLVSAAENRLRVLGCGDAQLARLRQSQQSEPLLAIVAPLTGVVVESPLHRGVSIEPGNLLATVGDPDRLWVEVPIAEADHHRVGPGDDAAVFSVAIPTAPPLPARVTAIAGALDEASRTILFRLEMTKPAGLLHPGMAVRVVLRPRHPSQVLGVPVTALRRLDGRETVFVETTPGHYQPRTVQPGRSLDGWVEIVSGLKAGERVVGDGSLTLKAELLKDTFAGE